MKKPFPSKVNWRAVWRHRWTILNMVNQIAHGTARDARSFSESYGGSWIFAHALYDAAKECIEVKK